MCVNLCVCVCVWSLAPMLPFPIIDLTGPRGDSQTDPIALRLAPSGGVPHPPTRSGQDLQPYRGDNSEGSLRGTSCT